MSQFRTRKVPWRRIRFGGGRAHDHVTGAGFALVLRVTRRAHRPAGCGADRRWIEPQGTTHAEAMMDAYATLANSADGVYAVDLEQTIVLWNAAAASILGHAPADVLGRKCFQVVKGRDADACAVCRRHCAAIEAAERGELPPTTDVATRRADGSDVWLNVSSVVVPGSRSAPAVLVHLFREVTKDHQVATLARELAQVVNGSGHAPASADAASADGANVTSLTAREREVLRLLAAGHATEEIARRLELSPYTVRNHVAAILKKLGLHSRLEAVTHAIRHGLA